MFHVKHEVEKRKATTGEAESIRKLYNNHENKLEEYLSELLWWNDKVNLVSRNVPRETLRRHIEHSLTITLSKAFTEADYIVDAGTGGGLPGIPLAIAMPSKEYRLNDIVSKKLMAVRQMMYKLKLSSYMETASASVEGLEMKAGAVLVSKHAFKINELWTMVNKQPWSAMLLLKGAEEAGDELEGIKEELDIKIVELEQAFNHSFYKGKAIVEIKRKGPYE